RARCATRARRPRAAKRARPWSDDALSSRALEARLAHVQPRAIEDHLDEVAERDAGMRRHPRKPPELVQPGERVALEHDRRAVVAHAQVDAAVRAGEERAVGGGGDVERALVVVAERRRDPELLAPGRVLHVVAVHLVAERDDLHGRERDVVQHRDRHLPSRHVLLDDHVRVVAARERGRALELAGAVDDRDAVARPFAARLEDERERSRKAAGGIAGAEQAGRRGRDAGGDEELLREPLVHRDRAPEDSRAGVGNRHRLEEALDAAVLAVAAVERVERDLDALGAEVGGHVPADRDLDDVVAALSQRGRRGTRAPLRDLALGGEAAAQHPDPRPAISPRHHPASHRTPTATALPSAAHRASAASQSPTSFTSGCSQTPRRRHTVSCTRRMSARTSAARAPPTFTMKFACWGEISAPPARAPFNPTISIRRPAKSPGGFLKIDPALGSPSGWPRPRFRFASAARRSIASRSPRASRISTDVTTKPSGRSRRRYAKASSSRASRTSSPDRVTPAIASTTCEISPPNAPAFMRSPPPTVPGIPSANSRPAKPRAIASTTTRAPPALSSQRVLENDRPSLTVKPGIPASATTRFVPPPSTKTGSD